MAISTRITTIASTTVVVLVVAAVTVSVTFPLPLRLSLPSLLTAVTPKCQALSLSTSFPLVRNARRRVLTSVTSTALSTDIPQNDNATAPNAAAKDNEPESEEWFMLEAEIAHQAELEDQKPREKGIFLKNKRRRFRLIESTQSTAANSIRQMIVEGELSETPKNTTLIATAPKGKNKEEDLKLTRTVIAKHLDQIPWQTVKNNPKEEESTIRSQKTITLGETLSNISSTARETMGQIVQSPRTSRAQKVHSVLQVPAVELGLGVLVLLNSALVAVDTLPNLPALTVRLIDGTFQAISYVFVVEFAARWYSRNQSKLSKDRVSKWNYLCRPLVLVDLVVVMLPFLLSQYRSFSRFFLGSRTVPGFLPYWLVSQDGLQSLRMLRILRLQRVLRNQRTFARFLSALGVPYDADGSERGRGVRPYQLQLTRVIVSVMTLFNVAAGLIYQAEHVVNPDISNYFSALYFAVCTLTTVGFGDITPITPAGRAVVCCSILAGVLVVPAQAADLVDALLKQRRRGGGLGTKTSSRSDSLPLTNSYDDSDSSDDEEGGDGYAIAPAHIKDTEHIQKSQHLRENQPKISRDSRFVPSSNYQIEEDNLLDTLTGNMSEKEDATAVSSENKTMKVAPRWKEEDNLFGTLASNVSEKEDVTAVASETTTINVTLRCPSCDSVIEPAEAQFCWSCGCELRKRTNQINAI